MYVSTAMRSSCLCVCVYMYEYRYVYLHETVKKIGSSENVLIW